MVDRKEQSGLCLYFKCRWSVSKSGFSSEQMLEVIAPFTMFKILRAWMAFGLQMRLLSMWMKSHYRPEIRCLDTRQAKRSFDRIFSCLEMAAESARTSAQEDRYTAWLNAHQNSRTIAVIEMGAGTALPTVRRHGEYLASRLNACLIRINQEKAKLSAVTYRVRR